MEYYCHEYYCQIIPDDTNYELNYDTNYEDEFEKENVEKGSDELLIDAIRGYPHLYNSSLKEYKDIRMKENSWKEIRLLTGMSGEDCQIRWLRLRERFTKEQRLREIDTRSGSGANHRSTFALYNNMLFLGSHVKRRKSFTNVKNCPPKKVALHNTLNLSTNKNGRIQEHEIASHIRVGSSSPNMHSLSNSNVVPVNTNSIISKTNISCASSTKLTNNGQTQKNLTDCIRTIDCTLTGDNNFQNRDLDFTGKILSQKNNPELNLDTSLSSVNRHSSFYIRKVYKKFYKLIHRWNLMDKLQNVTRFKKPTFIWSLQLVP